MGKKKVAQQTAADVSERVLDAQAKARITGKKKTLERARVYVNASYNNTVVSVTDEKGNVIAWGSAGSLGFSGPKKATPFAASKIISVIAEKLKAVGTKEIEVWTKGIGGGRDSSVRSLANQGFDIVRIKDVTPIPHNGPRPKKVRRV